MCVYLCPEKTYRGPTITADHSDLILIEEGTERNHSQPDGDSKQLEKIGETPPAQYRTTEDGGYEVDPDALSSSPIKGFCAIKELQVEEGREIDFHNQFSSRGSQLAGRRTSNRGQRRMQSKSPSYPSTSHYLYCDTDSLLSSLGVV